MKTKRFFLLAICLLLVFATLTSCASNERPAVPQSNTHATDPAPTENVGEQEKSTKEVEQND